MHDELLTRYSRHCLLPQIGLDGQERLLDSRVAILGLGGLGSAAAMYLAASGVGHITLCDFDTVDISNLQRQIAHRTRDVGRAKTESAADTLRELNPNVNIQVVTSRLDESSMSAVFRSVHGAVDATDNFATRFLINRTSLETQTPVVSGAAIRFEGQATVFDPRHADSPCYECLYPDAEISGETCAAAGVLAPLVGVVGSMQAVEMIKVLLNIETTLRGALWRINGLTLATSITRLAKDPECSACGKEHAREVATAAAKRR